MASEGYHEPVELLPSATKDLHRAIQSLVEELQAITWYQQRIDASDDAALQQVLAHNRDEEKEHASMLIEWIRRHDPCMEEHLRTYLFTEEPIGAIEQAVEAAGGPEGAQGASGRSPNSAAPPRELTVGSLMGRR